MILLIPLYKQIFSEKLHWEADAKVNTNLQRPSKHTDKVASIQSLNGKAQQVIVDIEKGPLDITKGDDQQEVQQLEADDPHVTKANAAIDHGIARNATMKKEVFEDDIPPPRPPRCISKQSDMDIKGNSLSVEDGFVPYANVDMLSNNNQPKVENEGNKPEIIYLTKEELRNILPDYNDASNVTLVKRTDTIAKNEVENMKGTEQSRKSSSEENNIQLIGTKSKLDLGENQYKENQGRKATISKKIKSLFSRNKGIKNGDAKREKRFSSTSKEIHKKGKAPGIYHTERNDNTDEIDLMVKYLGYYSPKLLKKIDSGKKIQEPKQKKKGETRSSFKKKNRIGATPVEKIANLGYISPKLAKGKGGVVLTGSKNKTDASTLSGSFDLKSGINDVYQEVDLRQCSNDIGCGHTNSGVDSTSVGVINKAFDVMYDSESSKENSDDDSFDSDISEEDRQISVAELDVNRDNSKLNPLQTTTFKYKVNAELTSAYELKQSLIAAARKNTKAKKPGKNPPLEIRIGPGVDDGLGIMDNGNKTNRTINTSIETLDRSKNSDVQVCSDFEKQGQELSEMVKISEKRVDILASELEELHITQKVKYVDDLNPYSKVQKQKKNDQSGKHNTITSKDDQASITEFTDWTSKKETEDSEAEMRRPIFNSAVFQTKQSSNNREYDTELTFEDELKAALAGIQASAENRILKTPDIKTGSETGSRPGTPRIPVKPIRLQGQEKLSYSQSLLGRKYGSTENIVSAPAAPLERSNRCQSLLVNKPTGSIRSNLLYMKQLHNDGNQVSERLKEKTPEDFNTAESATTRIGSMDDDMVNKVHQYIIAWCVTSIDALHYLFELTKT